MRLCEGAMSSHGLGSFKWYDQEGTLGDANSTVAEGNGAVLHADRL